MVVRLKTGVAVNALNTYLPSGAINRGFNKTLPVHVLEVPETEREAVAKALAASPLVEYVEPNLIRTINALTPADSYFSLQWGLTAVKATSAWSLLPGRFPAAGAFGARARVAVLDTGADCTHADFINSGGTSTNSASGGQLSFSLSQAIVPTTVSGAACTWQDDNGHGTHVAGIIAAAANNSAGVAGLGFPAELVIYKVMDSSGSGTDSDLAQAITAAADAGVDVISMSLSGPGYSQLLQDAIDYARSKNVLMVAAAGNDGSSALYYPADANFVIGVGATTSSDARATYSNYGFGLDVMAPGSSILSTYTSGQYAYMTGTSMATPFVAALGGLIATATPDLSAEAIGQRVEQSADLLTTAGAWTSLLGYGRINALYALNGKLPARTVGSLVGQVVDTTGTPVTTAQVVVGSASASTSSYGLFRMVNLAAGHYSYTVTASGYTPLYGDVVIPAGADAHVQLVLGANVGTVTGTVKTAGAITPGAVVEAIQSNAVQASAVTNSSGNYWLTVPAGSYTLRATAVGHVKVTSGSLTVISGAQTTSDLTLPALGTVSGTVANASSTPLANVQLTLTNGTYSVGAVSDSSGAYQTLGVPAGTYTLTAALSGYYTVTLSSIIVANDTTATANVTLSAVPVPSALTLSPSTIGGGAITNSNKVTLNSAAPAGGTVITLSSSNTALATVPVSVTVAAGATVSPVFSITTAAVTASTAVVITATANGISKTATLTLLPFAVSSVSLSPASIGGGNSGTYNRVYLNSIPPPGGAVVTLTSSAPAVAAVPASVTVAAGSTYSPYFTITTVAVSASSTVTITASYAGTSKSSTLTVTPAALSSLAISPTTISGGKSITSAYVKLGSPAPAGGATVALSSSSSIATPPASVTIAAGATISSAFTITTTRVDTATAATITATYNGASKSATITVKPASLSSVSISSSIVGGKSVTGYVYLDGPAGTAGATVTLTSSSALLTLPASVTVASGATSASFTASTSYVSTATSVTATAAYGGLSKTATTTLKPPALSSLSVSSSIVGGKSVTGYVYLDGPAGTAGATVTLTSSSALLTLPASVTVASGATSASFTASTSYVSAATSVTATATYNGVSKTAATTLKPPALSSVVVNSSIVGGKTSTGYVNLDGPAGTSGVIVTLVSSNALLTVPASVTVAAGASSASFAISTSYASAATSVTITATYNGVSKSTTTTLKPPSLSAVYVTSSITGGRSGSGSVYLDAPAGTGGVTVALTSSSSSLVVPSSVTIAAGASSTTFSAVAAVVSASTSATITASYNGVSKTATTTLKP